MAPYFIIFAILSMFAFSDLINVRKEQRFLMLLITSVILIIFAGLRYGDHDYLPYQLIFEESQSWNFEAGNDVGYSLLNSVLSLIWNDPLIVFITVATISVSLNIKSYGDYGKYVFIAILFYFVHNYALKEMIQIRSGLACAIGLYNVRNLSKGRYGKFWLLQFIAMTIHLGSVMFLIAWVLKQFNFSRKTWIYIFVTCFVIGMIYPFGAIIKSLPGIEILARVQTYSQWGEYAESIGILTNMATIKQLFISILILVFYDSFNAKIKYFDLLAFMYFASTCWLMVWNDFAIVGARLATFLSIGEPIIMSSIIILVTPNSRKIVLILFILMALLFLLTNMNGKILPYIFYPTI